MIKLKNKIKITGLLFLVLVTAACGQLIKPKLDTQVASLKSGEYKVDPKHTRLLFKVDHLGFAKYVGRFNDFEANLDFTPQNMEAASLSARVDMSSVDLNAEKLEQTLMGSSWFNVADHPYANFETTSARLTQENTAIFTGDLTFLGVAVPIDIEVKFNGGGINLLTASYTIGFEAHTQFFRSDFGLDNFIPAIGNKIELEIHAEFKRL